jgi:hypothetical protein
MSNCSSLKSIRLEKPALVEIRTSISSKPMGRYELEKDGLILNTDIFKTQYL